MEDYRINSSYAKALFDTARDTNVLDRVFDDMTLVGKTVCEDRLLGSVFANPVIRHDKKSAIVKELFGNEVCDLSLLFLLFVVKKNRAVNLKGIANAYKELYRSHKGIVHSDIVTAVEVDPSLLEEARTLVAKHTGKEVELEPHVSDKMIGGFRLTFDNNMYDARIRTKVAKLQREFAKNIYESKL